MSRMKEKNLRRFVALYIAGSVAFGGVVYAKAIDDPYYADGDSSVIVEANGQYDGLNELYGGADRINGDDDRLESTDIVMKSGNIGAITGGSSAEGVTKVHVDAANITIEGGNVSYIQGGGEADYGGATSTVDTVNIKITGGDINTNPFSAPGDTINTNGISGGGMAWAGELAGETNTSNVKNVNLTITGGTIHDSNDSSVDCAIWGGGIAGYEGSESSAKAIAHVDQVNMNISGGTIHADVYAGGATYGDASKAISTVDTAVINIGGGDIKGIVYGGGMNGATVEKSTINISGGTLGTDGQEFTHSVVGGGSADAESTSNVGTATININGGIFKSNVYGGGIAVGNNAVAHVGNVMINLGEGADVSGDPSDYLSVYAGGSVNGAGSNASVDTATVTLSGNAKVGDLHGGGDAKGGNVSVATSNIIVKDHAEVLEVLTGGGYTQNGGVSTVKVSNIQIDGGTVGAVSGGGYAAGTGQSTVDESKITINAGHVLGNVYAGGLTNNAVVGNSTINISGGEIGGGVLRGNATKAALNFTAGTGSTINGAVSGFDSVTVANGAKTNWTGTGLTHQFGALTVVEGGIINIGKPTTFDFAASTANNFKMARDVQNGNFTVAGAVNLAKGSTLTMENGIVTTSGKGAFFSEVDKDAIANSGKVAWGSNAQVKDDLHIGFSNLTNAELGELGKTDDFKDLVDNVADTSKLADGQRITNAKGSITDFEIEKTATGTNVITGPHTSASGVATYTGVRQGSAYISQNIVENIHEHTAGLRSGDKANAVWAGIRGGSTDVETGFGEAEVNAQYYQLGYDWDLSSNNKKAAIGLYFTKIAGDSTQNGFKNDIDSAYDFGIYGTKEFGGGSYMSLIGRYGQIGNSLRTDVQTTEWKDKGYGLSMEFGNRNTQANGLMLEPYIQFNYNHYSEADFNVGADHVGLDSGAMLDGKLGLRLIKQEGENPNNTIYGGIAYTRGLSGDFTLKNRTNGEKLGGVDNDANAFELSLGMNRQISACSTVNFNAKKEFGDYDGWSVQGMVNVSF